MPLSVQYRVLQANTDSNRDLPIGPGLLNRWFAVTEPDRAQVGDISSIHTDKSGLLLVVAIDRSAARGWDWSLRENMALNITINALHLACGAGASGASR